MDESSGRSEAALRHSSDCWHSVGMLESSLLFGVMPVRQWRRSSSAFWIERVHCGCSSPPLCLLAIGGNVRIERPLCIIPVCGDGALRPVFRIEPTRCGCSSPFLGLLAVRMNARIEPPLCVISVRNDGALRHFRNSSVCPTALALDVWFKPLRWAIEWSLI